MAKLKADGTMSISNEEWANAIRRIIEGRVDETGEEQHITGRIFITVGQVLQLRHRQATGISNEDIPFDFQPEQVVKFLKLQDQEYLRGLKRFAEKVRYEGEEPRH